MSLRHSSRQCGSIPFPRFAPRGGSVMRVLRLGLIWALMVPGLVGVAYAQDTKPRVRAITAFVRLKEATSQVQIAAALTVLREVKSEFSKEGYETQTLRIVTQPLAELVAGLSQAQALAYLKIIDDLGAREGFLP